MIIITTINKYIEEQHSYVGTKLTTTYTMRLQKKKINWYPLVFTRLVLVYTMWGTNPLLINYS